MRTLYRLLTFLLTPPALLWLQRAHAAPGERGRWRERLGRVPAGPPGRVWVHAASVGEINAAQGLIRALLERGETVLLSTFTATGAARCRELFGTEVAHHYLPLDNPAAVRKWLGRTQPRLGLILETEIWPELFDRCRRLEIPLILVSARVSASAERRYRRWPGLVGAALAQLSLAIAQSRVDADRLLGLGLPEDRLRIGGNLKFDLPLPADLPARAEALRQRWGARPVWVAGSTRPGEEELLLQAHIAVRHIRPDALLVLAPRHPDRAAGVAESLQASGLAWCRIDDTPATVPAVVLVDRLGLLLPCYAAADAAFVGGSLVALGGHNLIEPALLGKPVLAGPHLDQQADAAAILAAAGGLSVVNDAAGLADRLGGWLSNPDTRRQVGAAALHAVQGGRGSLETTLAALTPWLSRQEQ